MNSNRPTKRKDDLTHDLEIDAICVQFESELKSNNRPSLEKTISAASSDIRAELTEMSDLPGNGLHRETGWKPKR